MQDAKHNAGSGRIGASKFDTTRIASGVAPCGNSSTVERKWVNKIMVVPLFVLDYAKYVSILNV